MRSLIPIFYVAVAVVVATFADIFLKKAHFSNYSYLTIGALLYAFTAVPMALAFKTTEFSIVFLIWEGVAIILGLSVGIIIFKESLSFLKLAAFSFAFLAVIFSYFASK